MPVQQLQKNDQMYTRQHLIGTEKLVEIHTSLSIGADSAGLQHICYAIDQITFQREIHHSF